MHTIDTLDYEPPSTVTPLNNQPAWNDAVNTLVGSHDFYTAKAGLGIRFWRLRLYSTYEYQLTEKVEDASGLKTKPYYSITYGAGYYLFRGIFLGAEFYTNYPVVNYVVNDSGPFDYTQTDAVIDTRTMMAFTLGFQF